MSRVKKIDLDGLKTSEKLDKWADAVQLVKHLKMSVYAENTPENPTFAKLKAGRCGFAACAIGTAAVCFKGLALTPDESVMPEEGDPNGYFCTPQLTADFFGIRTGEALEIIYPDSYGGEYGGAEDIEVPKELVVGRIRSYAELYRNRGQ